MEMVQTLLCDSEDASNSAIFFMISHILAIVRENNGTVFSGFFISLHAFAFGIIIWHIFLLFKNIKK